MPDRLFMDYQINIRDFELMVFDIDGTILDSKHRLHSYTRETLLRLFDHNIRFTLATGKNLPATQRIADELRVELPLILSNGCMLQLRKGKVLDKKTLPPAVTKKVIEICEIGRRDLALYLDNGIYIKEMNHNYELLMEYGAPALIAVGNWKELGSRIDEVHKCLVVDRESRENLIRLEEIYRQKITDSVEYCHTLVEMLEVMPAGVSKLSALKKLLEILQIDMRKVMAFGDGNNDVEMLSAAGLGIAVENASEAAKRSADLVIASCDDNGPGKFIHDLIGVVENDLF